MKHLILLLSLLVALPAQAAGPIIWGPSGTAKSLQSSDLDLDNQKGVRLGELSSNGSNYIKLVGPDSVTSNTTLKWPDGAGTNGYCLTTDGTDTLTWTDPGVTLPGSLTDVQATELGYKIYEHGGSYNGGLAPTITLASDPAGGSLSSVEIGQFIPYRMQDGSWRMRFNIILTLTSGARAFAEFAIAGILFPNEGGGKHQTIVGNQGGNDGNNSTAISNDNNVQVAHDSTTTTTYGMSGDVALAAKPTWAY